MNIKEMFNKIKSMKYKRVKVVDKIKFDKEFEWKRRFTVIYVNRSTGKQYVDTMFLTNGEKEALIDQLNTDEELNLVYDNQVAVAVI